MKNLPYQNRSVAKRKNSIENKLSTYLAISGAYLAASPVDAQIIYTDIDPDVEMYLPAPFLGLSHQIDLNNDGVIDFNFVANYFWEQYSSNCSSPCSYIYYDLDLIPWNDNAALANQSPIGMLNSPVVVSSSNYVGSNVSTFGTNVVWWKHRQALARSDIIWGGLNRNGNWLNGETDKYVGLKLEVGGNTQYGWLR